MLVSINALAKDLKINDLSDFKNIQLFYHYSPKAEILSHELICPRTEEKGFFCKAFGTKIEIQVELNGCLDQIDAFEYDSYMYDGNLYIKLNIDAIYEKTSFASYCKQVPHQIKTIIVPFEDFENIIIEKL